MQRRLEVAVDTGLKPEAGGQRKRQEGPRGGDKKRIGRIVGARELASAGAAAENDGQ